MKLISRTIPLLFILILGAAASASAQTNVSAYFGVGSAWDSSSGQCVFLGFPGEAAGPCANGGYPTPALGGVFGVFGADFMFSHYLGVGGEYAFKFAQAPYGDANYRPEIWDFNALYHPITTHFAVLEVQGGLGGFDTKFYLPSQCSGGFGCSGTTFLTSADHFQVHVGIGVKLYVHGGVFVKPQFDLHIVPNLSGTNGQFGSDWVPEATVAVGYTFGER